MAGFLGRGFNSRRLHQVISVLAVPTRLQHPVDSWFAAFLRDKADAIGIPAAVVAASGNWGMSILALNCYWKRRLKSGGSQDWLPHFFSHAAAVWRPGRTSTQGKSG